MTPRLLFLVVTAALASCTCSERRAGRYRKLDAHTHAEPAAVPHLVRLMDDWGIATAVNLSGGWPGEGLEASLGSTTSASSA